MLFTQIIWSQTDASILFESVTRTYHYYLPSQAPLETYPLIFVLHGATQTGAEIADISLMHEQASGAIVVYPDGQSNTWNVGLPLGGSWNDVGFLDSLISIFIASYQADPAKIYFCGFSAGGYMSYRMACESAHCLAAVGSVSGTMVDAISQSCSPSHAMPIMHFHGTSDGVVAYNGGGFSGYSVNQVMQRWKQLDGCQGDSLVTALPDISTTDFSTVEKIQYTNCDANAEIILFKITGGGHTWPDNNVLLGGVGAINRDINATAELLTFFNAHVCQTDLVTVSEISNSKPVVFPNPFETALHVPADKEIQIFNSLGQCVYEVRSDQKGMIDFTEFPSGTYLLVIGRRLTHRVIKL
jgi:polyhydroxybutyrate depolymerase